MALVDDIRDKVARGEFEYSQHAVDQGILRQISVAELRQAFRVAQVIEDYPNDKYGPSCLLLGFSDAGRPLHIQPIATDAEDYHCLRAGRCYMDGLSKEEKVMNQYQWNEQFVEQEVTYVLETDDGLVIVENVPARVSAQTGERLFAPEVVEQLQELIWRKAQPKRVVQTPVYEFAA